MKRKGIIITCLSLIALLAIAGWFAGLFVFVQSLSTKPITEPLQKQDAIVTLTGGSNRLDTGFNLLERGIGKKLFISGVYHKTEVKQLLKRWKTKPQSNLDSCVVLGFDADNTAENAIETIAWLHKEGFHSFYLVTANYHIKRALLEFNRLAPDLDIIPFPVVPDNFVTNSWWMDPMTRTLVLREYMKYIAAYIFHRRRA
ncbi:MAG: YdcF family protein [Alphaproteobacteria bacterium]|nr:YdcF family protein [Alphaproteobacteria bacterium]MCK5518580.1 YdcF family protein [Alphaproteobacteria bacterium]MCK5659414.1 YdcF family protein [Alphaproteobacteria bacterium]